MSLTPTQLQELQTIVLDLGEEFPHNADFLWNAAIRMQKGDLGPVTGSGGVPAFEAAVADIKVCQEEVQNYQQRQGSPNSGFDVAVLQAIGIGDPPPSGNLGEIQYIETAPNIWAATDQILITPAGPNSVQMDEVGTTVFRTVPAASGGVEINNLSTGAGFERVLTTADLGGGAVPGGVDTNIQFNTAGAFDGSDGLSWDEANRRLIIDRTGGAGAGIKMNNLLSNTPALEIGGVGSASTNHIIWKSFDQSATQFWQMVSDHSLSVGNHKLEVQSSATGTTPFIEFDGSGEMSLFGSQTLEAILFTGLTGTKKVKFQIPLFMEERANADADVLTEGQWWVRNDDPNTPMFTDDLGNDHVLNAVPDPLTLGRAILTNTNDPDLVDTTVALNVGAVDPDASQHIEIGNSDIQSKGSDTTTGQLNLNAVGGNIFIGAQTGSGNVRIFNNGEDVFQTIAQGIQVLGAETNDPTTGGTQRTFINLQNNIGALTTFLGHGIAATTDCILRNAVRSGLMTIEGVDSGNANTPLFRGDPDGQAEMFNDGASVARSLGAAAGGLEANNTLTGAGFERVLTTSDAGGVVTQIEDGAGNIAVIGQGLGVIGVRSVGNTDAEERDLEWQFQDGTTRASIGNEFFTDLIFRNHITGRNMIFNCGTGGASRIRLHLDGTSATGGASLYAGTSAVPRLQSLIHGVEIGNGTLFLVEQAAQEADIAGQGQLWVDSADDSLKYVTEAGVVFDLTAGLTQPITLTADIDGDGFNLDDMGVMFMREQATSDADVATQGQLWVRTDAFSNTLMFTNDNGNDMEVMGLPLNGDSLDGTLLLTGTGFVGAVNLGPKSDSFYMLTFAGAVAAPAADDIKIQLTVDTNSLFLGTFVDSTGQVTEIRSNIGTVVTNTVVVPTDGSTLPSGGHTFSITGILHTGATAPGTLSLRAAKNADTGADGGIYFPAGAVQFISP